MLRSLWNQPRVGLLVALVASMTVLPANVASADDHFQNPHDRYAQGCDTEHPVIKKLVADGLWVLRNRVPDMLEAMRQGYRPLYPFPNDTLTAGDSWHWVNPQYQWARTDAEYTPEHMFNVHRVPFLLMVQSHYAHHTMDWAEPTMAGGWVPAGMMFTAWHIDQTGVPVYDDETGTCNPFHWHTTRRGDCVNAWGIWGWLWFQRFTYTGDTTPFTECWGEGAHMHFWPSHHVHPFFFYAPHLYDDDGKQLWAGGTFGGFHNPSQYAPWEGERIQEATQRDIERGADRCIFKAPC